MNDNQTYRIRPLKWQRKGWSDVEYIHYEAPTPFGCMTVKWTLVNGWEWGFCFTEYYDESYFPCASFREAKAMANAYWEMRVRKLLIETRPPLPISANKTFSRLFTGVPHGKT